MPFHREWDREAGEYTINRERTGPLPVPQTGTTVQEGGAVIFANQAVTPAVPPPTPVQVNFPGPNEPIVGPNGLITPRWWRFLDELYRRTGGPVDNINKQPLVYLPPDTDALVLSGKAPTLEISHGPEMSVGSISIAGQNADRTVV